MYMMGCKLIIILFKKCLPGIPASLQYMYPSLINIGINFSPYSKDSTPIAISNIGLALHPYIDVLPTCYI